MRAVYNRETKEFDAVASDGRVVASAPTYQGALRKGSEIQCVIVEHQVADRISMLSNAKTVRGFLSLQEMLVNSALADCGFGGESLLKQVKRIGKTLVAEGWQE